MLKIAGLKQSDLLRLDEERRRKIGEGGKKRTGKKNSFFGKHHTKESKELMRKSKLGKKASEKTKQKMSKAHERENLSESTRQKYSEEIKSRWENKEYRQKMTERMIGENNPFYGKHHTKESKERMSLSNIGKGLKQVNLTPSTNLAYILGSVIGDGNLSRSEKSRYHRIEFGVADEEFCKLVGDTLEKIGLHCSYRKRYKSDSNKSTMYCLQAGSKIFYNFVKQLKIDASKSFNYLNTESTIIAFLKGVYESEGCYYWKSKSPTITFTNKDAKLLNLVKRLLQSLQFNPKLNYWQKYDGGKVTLGKQEEILRFLALINPCIKFGEDRKLKIETSLYLKQLRLGVGNVLEW